MSDQESFREKRRKWREDRRKKREEWRAHWQGGMGGHSQMRSGGIWTGIFILLIGIAFLVRNTVDNIPTWVFSWQMLVLSLGLLLGIKQVIRGGSLFAPLVLMLVGGAFLAPEIDPGISVRRYIWPIVLIAMGLYFIARSIRMNGRKDDDEKKNSANKPFAEMNIGVEDATAAESAYDSKEDFIDSTSIFGGTKKNVISKNFKGGDLVSVFGGTEIDLTRADFNGTASLELTTIFGGTKLIIPSHWEIKSEATVIFGGIEDKRSVTASPEGTPKKLLLTGTVLFGGIDIRSY